MEAGLAETESRGEPRIGAAPATGRISYKAFWPLYLAAHRHPATRACHYAATFIGAFGTAAAIWLGEPLLAVAGILLGYVLAVVSHRVIEHNRALIRINPLYGAICDLRMLWMALTLQLAGEYRRLGLAPIDEKTASNR